MSDSSRPTPAPRKPGIPPKKTVRKSSSSSEFSLTHVSTSSVVYNKHEQVLLVVNKSLPCNVNFTVYFTGLQSEKISKTNAEKIGDNVLILTAPEHFPPEETKLTVHHGNHATKLCTYVRPFCFKSPLQVVKESLLMVSDPVEFMCAALHLRQKSNIALDCELEKNFRRNIPPDFNLLVDGGRERVDGVEAVSSDPTLLHFAARYNLFRLAVALLECPGGSTALNTTNQDQLTPIHIAADCGHQQLADVLADAQQNPNRLEEIYQTMTDPIYSDYISLETNEDEQEVYVSMNYAEEQELYAKMTGFGIDECDEENIYQNADEVAEDAQALEDSGYESRTDLLHRGRATVSAGIKPTGTPWDSRSMQSISSTSSSESNTSAGSGSDYSTRPMLPEPGQRPTLRARQSLQDLAFERRAMEVNGKSRTLPGNYYVKRGDADNQNVYSHQHYEQGNVPPPPPPKNPNVN